MLVDAALVLRIGDQEVGVAMFDADIEGVTVILDGEDLEQVEFGGDSLNVIADGLTEAVSAFVSEVSE